MSKKIDLDSHESDLKGYLGHLEKLCRKYKSLAFALAIIPTAMAYFSCIIFSIFPCLYLFISCSEVLENSSNLLKAFAYAICFTCSLGIFSILLLFIVPLFNKILPLKKEYWRGNWYSLRVIPWFYHNALVMLVRYSVLKYFQTTPLINWFYRRMGMKMGKGCIINTEKIQDPCLIELGDYVTLGGSCHIFCHYGQGGYLIIAPVKIGSRSTIGLKASIMGDVEIGENILVPPHTLVPPKSRMLGDKS